MATLCEYIVITSNYMNRNNFNTHIACFLVGSVVGTLMYMVYRLWRILVYVTIEKSATSKYKIVRLY